MHEHVELLSLHNLGTLLFSYPLKFCFLCLMASDKGEGKTVEKKSEKHRFLSDMNLSRLVTIVLNPKRV